MKSENIAIPARYYLRLLDHLAVTGLPTSELLKRAGINPRGLREPDAQLRLSQVENLLDMALDEYHIPGDSAFELGALLSVTTHSIVGFGMLNSPHIEHSLKFLARFFRLVMPTFSMRYNKHRGGATITWHPVVGRGQRCLSFHLEAIATAAYREVCELSPDLPTFRVDVSIEQPAHRSRYNELDGARWHFASLGQPGIRMQFDFDASKYPLNTADSNALNVAEARCRALQQSVAVKGAFKDWVLMMLRDAANGQPSLTDLASVLNLSARSLNRHLAKEGCSFRQLSNQVQHQLACERLRDPHLSITEIALSLGFSETSNFSRFFKQRQGLSPRDFRHQAQHDDNEPA